MLYAIQATVVEHSKTHLGVSQSVRQVPTFYLDDKVQGIVSPAHAAQIAREIVRPREGETVHLTAVAI